MLYVERDEKGRIIGMHSTPRPNAREEKASVDEELLEFLNAAVNADPRKLLLSLSDMGIVRLLEDLIDLLVRKNIILFTELPEQAQQKIRERERLRESIGSDSLTVDDIL